MDPSLALSTNARRRALARAVIFGGGRGTRLSPLTQTTPKPLIPLAGRPVLSFLLEHLREAGVEEIIMALHHGSDSIREAFRDGRDLGVRIEYVEEPTPLGTIGALPLLRDRLAEPFFVLNADLLTKCDFRAMWEFHHRPNGSPWGTAMTVGMVRHSLVVPFAELAVEGDHVTALREKPRKDYLVNAGIYVLDPSVIELIPRTGGFDAPDLIRRLIDRKLRVKGYFIEDYWLDVGRHADLEKARQDVSAGLFD